MVIRRILPASVGEGLFLSAVFLVSYVLVQLSGVLVTERPGVMRVLHQTPALAACAFIMIISTARALGLVAGGGKNSAPRLPALMFYGGCALMTAGVLVSSQVRFEGNVVLTEGQAFSGDASEYVEGTVYRGRLGRYPRMAMVMKEVSPYFWRQGRTVLGIRAEADFRSGAAGSARPITMRSFFPALAEGLLLRVRSFGYSPFYRIVNTEGRVFDEAFVMLKLFPPGSEDSFRTIELPHTFYLRYYPGGLPARDALPPNDGALPRPVFKIRVSRNLDLMLNDRVLEINEKLDIGPVPPLYLSVEAVRKWAEVRLVNDYGLFIILPGSLLVILAFVAAAMGRGGLGSVLGVRGGD